MATSETVGAISASTIQRLYRAFMGARAALGLALLATQSLAGLMGAKPTGWTTLISLIYGTQAVLAWMLPRWFGGGEAPPKERAGLSTRQFMVSIGADLVLFTLLQVRDPSGPYGALFFMPALMAGALQPRLRALGCAALPSLVLLSMSGWAVLNEQDGALRISQAGLLGCGLFVVTLLANEIASRLAREERAARGSLEYARQQADLNRLVIEEMQEGVAVVDRRGLVRTANPAARALLAEGASLRSGAFRLDTTPAWKPLLRAVEKAFAGELWPEAGRDLLLDFGRGSQRSACLLLYKDPLSETAQARLQTIKETEDGFVIAERDLELRGQGDLLGTRQSGMPGYHLAVADVHRHLLEYAHDDARNILRDNPGLTGPHGEAVRGLLYLFRKDLALPLIRAG